MIQDILDRFPDIRQHYLLIAQGRVFVTPTLVHTVLGSCVAVTFYCPSRRLGGLFHAMLPRASDYHESLGHEPYRYVDTAILSMWRRFTSLGVDRTDVQCKIFGGANPLVAGEYAAGERNALTAFECLERLGLRVVASHVGGKAGRKLLFLSHTGEVYVKTLKKQQPLDLGP